MGHMRCSPGAGLLGCARSPARRPAPETSRGCHPARAGDVVPRSHAGVSDAGAPARPWTTVAQRRRRSDRISTGDGLPVTARLSEGTLACVGSEAPIAEPTCVSGSRPRERTLEAACRFGLAEVIASEQEGEQSEASAAKTDSCSSSNYPVVDLDPRALSRDRPGLSSVGADETPGAVDGWEAGGAVAVMSTNQRILSGRPMSTSSGDTTTDRARRLGPCGAPPPRSGAAGGGGSRPSCPVEVREHGVQVPSGTLVAAS